MQKNIPVRDFFKNPDSSSYQISKDGKYLGFLSPFKSRMNICVIPLDGGEEIRVTEVTDRDIAGFSWLDGNRILYTRDFGGDENFHLFGVDLDGKNLVDLTPFDGVKAMVLDPLDDTPDEMLILLNKRNPQIFDPYRLNVKTGNLEMVSENPGNITGWQTDHDGKIRLATITDGVNITLMHRKSEQDEFVEVLTTNFKETLSPLFFSFDNEELYCVSNRGRDKSAIVRFDPLTAKELEVVYEHPEVDISSMSFSKKRKVLTVIGYTTWKKQLHFLDKEREQLQNEVEALLPGKEIAFISSDEDEQIFIVRTYSDRSLGAYYVYDFGKKTLRHLTDVSPWLDEDLLAEMKPVSYQSRDGLTIHGYLTLPKGRSLPVPIVVNPHGGPWVRDTWTYNPEVQFLANRGYGVLQINYRGSTGYGRAFWEASFKQWGLKMQDDISDGVRYLIDEGIANEDRIAIYGGSYGGYATLAGITLTPDLYCCAVDYVGVSNLFTFMETIPPYWEPYKVMLHEMVGNPDNEEDAERMKKTSPVFLVDKIKVPLLIAQGAKDPRVNVDESDQIVNALKERGIDVQYLLKSEEGHGFRNEENRFEFYETMDQFLANNL